MNEIKNQIIKKYGSVIRFAELANLNYFTLIKKINNDPNDAEYKQMIKEKIEKIDNHLIKGKELTDDLKSRLRQGVLNHPDSQKDGKGSIYMFCENNPEFNPSYLARIFSRNQFSIKLVSKKVNLLMKKLNIEP